MTNETTPTHDDRAINQSDTELVAPGAFPLRIQPAAALMPGRGDPIRLMIVWFMRKSVYWMVGVGLGIGAAIDETAGNENGFEFDGSPGDFIAYLASWYSLVVLAIIVRFLSGWLALAEAWPLAKAHETGLSPRTNLGSGIGKFFDRLHVARAFRALRWTHHVRQVALARLGPLGRRLGRLDPILDVVNITTIVLGFLTLILVGATVSTS